MVLRLPMERAYGLHRARGFRARLRFWRAGNGAQLVEATPCGKASTVGANRDPSFRGAEIRPRDSRTPAA